MKSVLFARASRSPEGSRSAAAKTRRANGKKLGKRRWREQSAGIHMVMDDETDEEKEQNRAFSQASY